MTLPSTSNEHRTSYRCILVRVPHQADVQAEGPEPTLKALQVAVEAVTGVPRRELLSRRRDATICRARHIYFWAARNLTKRSFPVIGYYCGGRDHSTVMNGINRVNVDRVAFERLRAVDGVGPKTALAALDVLGLQGLLVAVAADDLRALEKIPGVGKKLAQRLALAEGCSCGKQLGDFTTANVTMLAAGAADAEAALASSQAEVVRLTEEWAVLALQRQMLSDVLEMLGSDDTRPLLTHAGQILDRLTGGRWVALRAEEEGASRKMLVVRADADRFSTSELSEGTADQVYLSLRLAAVAELHSESVASGQHALPLVLDDVLMSFDDVRASDALGVLHDLAPGLQVIVFTHHMNVADAAVATPGVTVARLPEPTPISGAIDGDQVRAHAQDGAVSGDSNPRPALADGRQVDPAEVRRWAESQGINVSARGRVQQALIDQYRAAHSQ